MKFMTSDDFTGRVEYAARCISEGRDTSCNRAFSSCFEMDDGDEVVTMLIRLARRRPALSVNLHKYLDPNTIYKAADRLAHVPDSEMAAHAAATRARRLAEWNARYATA